MAVWSWDDVAWGAAGPPEWIRARLSAVGPRAKDASGKPLKDERPRKPRFRLTPEGEKQAVAALGAGTPAPDVAHAMRVPVHMVESAATRAGPHDCAYGCGPTRTFVLGRPAFTDNTIRQRVRCGCEKGRCWTRITMKDLDA